MEAAVQRALEVNPLIDAATATLQASESARKAAQGAFGPTLNSGYNYTRNEKARVSMGRTVMDKHVYTFNINASQPLFTGFNLLSAYQKSALENERQALTLENTRLQLVMQVQTNFLNYLKAEEYIRSIQRAVDRAMAQLALAQASFKVGVRPRLDVLQAELDLSTTHANLIQAENVRETTRANLNTLLNLPVDAPTDYVGDLALKPFDRPFDLCLQRAFDQRPDIKMAQKSIDIAEKDLVITKSAFYPQVNATMQWSTQGDQWKAAGSAASPTDYSTWQAGLALQWNLFSSGQRWNNTQRAGFLINKVEAEMASLVNNVAYEVKSLLLMTQDAGRRVVVAEKSVISAQEAYNDAKMRYELQLGTNLDLLTAQSALSTEEAALISAKTDYMTALAQLYVAMGEMRPDLQP